MSLLGAIETLTNIFNSYAEEDGDKGTLSKDELAKLLRKEMCMGNAKKEELDKFFNDLDHDGSGQVNFTEYITFVAALAMIINDA